MTFSGTFARVRGRPSTAQVHDKREEKVTTVANIFTRRPGKRGDDGVFAPNRFIIYNVRRGVMVAELLDLLVRAPYFVSSHELPTSQRDQGPLMSLLRRAGAVSEF